MIPTSSQSLHNDRIREDIRQALTYAAAIELSANNGFGAPNSFHTSMFTVKSIREQARYDAGALIRECMTPFPSHKPIDRISRLRFWRTLKMNKPRAYTGNLPCNTKLTMADMDRIRLWAIEGKSIVSIALNLDMPISEVEKLAEDNPSTFWGCAG